MRTPRIPATVVFCALAGCAMPANPTPFELTGLPAPRRLSREVAAAAPQGTVRSEGDISAFASAGLTASPETILIGGGFDYYTDSSTAVGALVQVGFDSDDTIVAPSIQLKHFFLLDSGGRVSRWRPFAQVGVGMAYLEKSNADEIGLLLNAGGGIDYALDDISIGTNVLFNLLPIETVGDHFFFSWQVVQITFHF